MEHSNLNWIKDGFHFKIDFESFMKLAQGVQLLLSKCRAVHSTPSRPMVGNFCLGLVTFQITNLANTINNRMKL